MFSIVETLRTKKVFFSRRFCLSLKLCDNETIKGEMEHFAGGLKLRMCFEGFYRIAGETLELAFFIDWSHPNTDSTVLTAFSGCLIMHDRDSICLLLKWLRVTELYGLAEPCCINDFEILLDCRADDVKAEQEKLLSREEDSGWGVPRAPDCLGT